MFKMKLIIQLSSQRNFKMNPQKCFTEVGISCFMKQTQLFNLKVTFSGEKLCVSLENIEDWIAYYKQYTTQYVGDEIHKRVDINDIYVSFIQSATQDCKDDCSVLQDISLIPFGQIIKSKNIPCFKVLGNGLITVYVTLFDQRTNKLLEFQSNLRLDVLGFISEQEKVSILLTRQKNNLQSKYIKQITFLQKENQKLKLILKRYENIGYQKITKINNEDYPLKNRLRKKIIGKQLKKSSISRRKQRIIQRKQVKKLDRRFKQNKTLKQNISNQAQGANTKQPKLNKKISKQPTRRILSRRAKKIQKKSHNQNFILQIQNKQDIHENKIEKLVQDYFLLDKNKKRTHWITTKEIQKYLKENFSQHCIIQKQLKQVVGIVRKKHSFPISVPFTVVQQYRTTNNPKIKQRILNNYDCNDYQMRKKIAYRKSQFKQTNKTRSTEVEIIQNQSNHSKQIQQKPIQSKNSKEEGEI